MNGRVGAYCVWPKTSGQTFCRAIQQVLKPIRDIAASFVDDVAVHSMEFEAHLDMDKFLSVVRKSGIKKVSICATSDQILWSDRRVWYQVY